MPVTDADFQDLKSRVGRLERASVENTETITWLAGTLGTMKAVQDNHTQRLDRVETKLDRVDKTLNDLVKTLPSIVSDAMRDVMKDKR